MAFHGDHPMKEEEKRPHSRAAADYMLSQESIKQYEQAVEQETAIEREKLKSIERQKREFAKKLRETQDQEFKSK
jgi:hypothetical protein